MKRPLFALALLGLFSSAPAIPAYANNGAVENALAGYSDTSTFYAAMLNTGVARELDPNAHYTVFAPTNEAFAAIRPNAYPCFYSTQCRVQVADIIRDHIVTGGRTLKELVHEGEIPTIGRYRVYAESPFVGDYAISNNKVLSGAEVRGNMIYRIDGVIISNQQLAQFHTVPPLADNVAQERTIVTYRTPSVYPVPGGTYPRAATTTVIDKTYLVPGTPASTTVIYPDGTETKTTERAYIYPDSYSGEGETTTVTKTITTRP